MGTSPNIGNHERWLSSLLGSLLIGYGFRKGKWSIKLPLLLIGSDLIRRGITGYSYLYKRVGMTTRQPMPFSLTQSKSSHFLGSPEFHAMRSVTIAAPRERLFEYWRNLNNLPSFMKFIEKVEVLSPQRSRLILHLSKDLKYACTIEIVEEKPNELISFRTVEPSDLDFSGQVFFKSAPNSQGTEVRQILNYSLLGGRLGQTLTRFSGLEPSQQLRTSLRRFKKLMEAGELITAELAPNLQVAA